MPLPVLSRPALASALAAVLTLTSVLVAAPAAAQDPVGPLPTAEDFVTQQYEDFLARAPEAAGLAYWSAQLKAGYDPAALIESLALSPEFEGTMAPVVRLYYAHFLRPPDYAGMTYWAEVARSGVSMAQISEAFVESLEFKVTYGSLTDEQYVNQVYLNVLNRPPDHAGLVYWTGQMAGGLTRGEVMLAFSDSPEYRDLTGGRVLATMLYVGMLRRAPESAGLDYWATTIDQVPYRHVIAGFLGAAEYRDRIAEIYHDVQPLTGVPTRGAVQRPALAVKIDNVDRARPQRNIEHADVIYEEMVEGSLTRLVVVFHSHLPTTVGPVRSVRTTDFHLLDQLNTPLLAASGANPGVLALVDDADLVNVNALAAGNAYFRDGPHRAPHNLYARVDDLYRAAGNQGGQPPVLFHYREPGTAPTGGVDAANGVSVDFGSAQMDATWSPTRKGWLRRQNGTAHGTQSGTQLAPANLVVLEVAYGTSPVDANSPEAHTVGTGVAHVFTGGQRVTGTWTRANSTDPIRLLDKNGNDIGLARGQTMVELAPPGSITLRAG